MGPPLVKRILHVITGLDQGGAEAVLYRLCTHDPAHAHHVVSLTGRGKYGPLLAEAGIEVTCLEMPPGRITAQGLRKLWQTMRKSKADVVQTWMYHANLLGGAIARLGGQRNLCWGIRQSRLEPAQTSRSTLLVDRACARLSSVLPRLIVCCAENAMIAHAGRGYDPGRMLLIPNGYDLSAFRPDPAARAAVRSQLGLGDGEVVIGFVARHHPYKGHADLFRALAMLQGRNIRPTCLLVGTGMDESNSELGAAIAEAGLSGSLRLVGPRSDVPAVMNALDLHIMSSVTEGFPNVLAEAMACGTPCVSTDVGDAAQIVSDKGMIVPPRNPTALADAIAAMLAEAKGPFWAARQEACRRHIADNFSLPLMIDRYHRAWFDRSSPPMIGEGKTMRKKAAP